MMMMSAFRIGLLALATSALPSVAQFKTETRLVEVYATVYDPKGHYVDGLLRDRFNILDNGEPQSVIAFESNASEFSCAILLDTTGSMRVALASVKNAASRFIDRLRPEDSVAVYGFSGSLNLLQDFTTEKNAAKRAVQRTRAFGQTALFDAIAQAAQAISARKGKKVIIVFTDGADNASVLHPESAITRAKKAGVPVYTVAEGDALESGKLLKELGEISESTGASAYQARKGHQIGEIFDDIVADLQHMYLLVYKPPVFTQPKWRRIDVLISGLHGVKVRGKKGYFPE